MDFITGDQPWLQFKQPLVRELAFSIASPPLLHHWPEQLCQQHTIDLPDTFFWQTQFMRYLPRLKQLDRDVTPLEKHLGSLRSTRLGIRFEHLLTFWLQDNLYHPFELLGQSIKRMEGQRTIGEMDFLIRHQDTRQIEHWEVAIKFYLGEASFMSDQWIGLNRRDTLGRKIRHLCDHQFNVETVHDLVIDKRRAIIKGRLFYPANSGLTFPEWISHQHLAGTWGHEIPFTPPGYIWRRASRPEWLTEQRCVLPVCSPSYWTDGLYFLLDTENQVVFRYMLRIVGTMHRSVNKHNILKLKLT